jgi:hypothetical protein
MQSFVFSLENCKSWQAMIGTEYITELNKIIKFQKGDGSHCQLKLSSEPGRVRKLRCKLSPEPRKDKELSCKLLKAVS